MEAWRATARQPVRRASSKVKSSRVAPRLRRLKAGTTEK